MCVGIKRIANVTSRLVPSMCIIYVLSATFIILGNIGQLPTVFALILREAFSGDALYGGFLGIMVTGITRAAFSNEAGIGTAPMAHGAAKTKEPVREGLVAMIGPFIDTHIICTLTALVILISGVSTELSGHSLSDDPESVPATRADCVPVLTA